MISVVIVTFITVVRISEQQIDFRMIQLLEFAYLLFLSGKNFEIHCFWLSVNPDNREIKCQPIDIKIEYVCFVQLQGFYSWKSLYIDQRRLPNTPNAELKVWALMILAN